jgi:hypothetical protein
VGREIVNVADADLDGTPDLVWRNPDNGNMYVRHGKPGPETGSVELASLTTVAASRNGDVLYGTGWAQSQAPALIGVPDLNGDRVPDMWARSGTDGKTSVHHPSTTSAGPPTPDVILGTDWSAIKSFGRTPREAPLSRPGRPGRDSGVSPQALLRWAQNSSNDRSLSLLASCAAITASATASVTFQSPI